jgi:phosphoribosyl 1,2-cyclic phosphodiesterase
MQSLHAIVLEFNHDEVLLQASQYPPFLKQRIAGGYGHLSNVQAASLLQTLLHQDLEHVVAAHLSEQNNHPDLVRDVLESIVSGFSCQTHIANAESGFDWLQI